MSDPQRRANERAWAGAGPLLVRHYARGGLRPAETAVLERHREALSARTLELGCGAGRVTRHLIALGGDVHGIDLAPAMVRRCRRDLRGATFSVGDMLDLSSFAAGSFDAVVAAYNVVDVFGDADRGRALDEMRRVLRPGGLLVLCTHNLAAADAGELASPTTVRRTDPLRFAYDAARVPLRLRNHRRLRRLERREDRYALVNDVSHNFNAVHYYAPRDEHERQAAAHGFAVLEVVDRHGDALGAGDPAPHSIDLHVVARAV